MTLTVFFRFTWNNSVEIVEQRWDHLQKSIWVASKLILHALFAKTGVFRAISNRILSSKKPRRLKFGVAFARIVYKVSLKSFATLIRFSKVLIFLSYSFPYVYSMEKSSFRTMNLSKTNCAPLSIHRIRSVLRSTRNLLLRFKIKFDNFPNVSPMSIVHLVMVNLLFYSKFEKKTQKTMKWMEEGTTSTMHITTVWGFLQAITQIGNISFYCK